MKDPENLKTKVKELIRDAKTQKAFKLLESEDLAHLNTGLIMLSSRFAQLKEEQRMGVIEDSSFQIKLNQINLALLDLVDQIGQEPKVIPIEETIETTIGKPAEHTQAKPQETKKSAPSTPTPSKSNPEKNEVKKYALIGGAILLLGVGGFFGFQNVSANKQAEEAAAIAAQERADSIAAEERKQAIAQDSLKKVEEQRKKEAQARAKKVILGKTFEGGKIIHIDTLGKRCLIMAPGDILDKPIAWFEKEVDSKYAQAYNYTLYGGKANTKAIIKKFGDGKYPAQLCKSYSYAEKNDWYLPSKQELDLMYDFSKKNNINTFSDDYYWSSTEVSNKGIYFRSFYNGRSYTSFEKDSRGRPFVGKIRPIRQYTWE